MREVKRTGQEIKQRPQQVVGWVVFLSFSLTLSCHHLQSVATEKLSEFSISLQGSRTKTSFSTSKRKRITGTNNTGMYNAQQYPGKSGRMRHTLSFKNGKASESWNRISSGRVTLTDAGHTQRKCWMCSNTHWHP